MRYAIIENGRVTNIAEAEPEFAAEMGWIEAGDNINIGMTYDGVGFGPPPAPTPDEIAAQEAALRNAVNAERDRRTAAGFTFAGHVYQSRPDDLANVAGAFSLATFAIISGAQAGNYRWHNGPTDFEFIAANNDRVKMDAQTVIGLGATAAAWKSGHIFAANTLKGSSPIPADFADDRHWPA